RFARYLGETYNNLGAIHYRRKDHQQALWYLSRAAAKRPSSPRVHYNYGLALSLAQKRDRALEELVLATELDPTDVEIRFAMGVVLLRLGRVEEAEKAFHECVRSDPKHERALHNLRLIDELRRRAREGEIQVE
ncbi:MAG: tetratricopeptide repeat protein, partial [Deltaproteobacteria bacterium]|nr:tetratricopeptide repeat protein [Deltaproteobacteria bacterium]